MRLRRPVYGCSNVRCRERGHFFCHPETILYIDQIYSQRNYICMIRRYIGHWHHGTWWDVNLLQEFRAIHENGRRNFQKRYYYNLIGHALHGNQKIEYIGKKASAELIKHLVLMSDQSDNTNFYMYRLCGTLWIYSASQGNCFNHSMASIPCLKCDAEFFCVNSITSFNRWKELTFCQRSRTVVCNTAWPVKRKR